VASGHQTFKKKKKDSTVSEDAGIEPRTVTTCCLNKGCGSGLDCGKQEPDPYKSEKLDPCAH
jgi:hypothetical protein